MLNRIEVRSKPMAAAFRCDVPWACISISTVPGEWPEIDVENRLGLLQLAFADVEFESREASMAENGFHIFDDGDAQKIIEFVKEHSVEMEVLMVHCEGGQSRSAGVAAAIAKLYLPSDDPFFKAYTPNMRVYRRILDNAGCKWNN